MKAVRNFFFISGGVVALYALVNICMSFANYVDYIAYYGIASVLLAVLDGAFSNIGWALLFIGLGLVANATLKIRPDWAFGKVKAAKEAEFQEALEATKDAKAPAEVEEVADAQAEIAVEEKAE